MPHVRRNERGIALVITLLVVALLTITVIEFTYSVEIDQHMARNALNSLQASLLARSGVNLGEAVLLHDDDPQADGYTEDWGNIDELNSQLVIPENMRLRVQVLDEGGKLNINLTKPLNVGEWRMAKTANPNAPERPFQSWQTAFGHLLESQGVDPSIAQNLADYWDSLYQASFPDPNARPGTQPPRTPTPAVGATPGAGGNSPQLLWDFPSLDDASVIPGLTPAVLRRLRPLVSALDPRRQTQVNANTAPRVVLSAVIEDDSVVENIISARQQQTLRINDLAPLLASLNPNNPATRNVRAMLGVRSSYFLIRSSAIVNPNPLTGRGGIRRSAAMLVRRDPKPGVPPQAPPGTPRWTLTQLDWQKEGGAALFQQRTDQEPGVEDPTAPDALGMGG